MGGTAPLCPVNPPGPGGGGYLCDPGPTFCPTDSGGNPPPLYDPGAIPALGTYPADDGGP